MRGSTLVSAPTALALGLLPAGCGSDTDQRASTGALTAIGVGAVVGGPVGAVVGVVVGGVGGAAAPEGADQLADSAIHKEKSASQNALNSAGLGPNAASSARVEAAQRELQREGLYRGKIDGIAGPDTRQAITAFQQREGLRQTARLDHETMDRSNTAGGEATGSSEPPPPPSDSNAPNH